jgi:poly-gamma-glutamate synthesis protein (capsule biosynthesis protein)
MRNTKRYLRVLIAFIVLGAMTGITIGSGTILSRRIYAKAVNPTLTFAPATREPTQTHELETHILFTGDINLGRCIAKRTIIAHGSTNNYDYPFEFVGERLKSADITVGSLDASLSDESPPMPCPESMNLISPPYMVEGLQHAGFDVISIATNHAKDCGNKGFDCDGKSLLDTIDTLKSAGIQPAGAGSNLQEARLPVIVEKNGIRFAFLGFDQINERVWATENTPGAAPIAKAYISKITAQIKAVKQDADVVIVLLHWGAENNPEPVDIQRVWARDFVEAGASLVIGNHPHIIQPMEVFSDKLIFYSLGNFVFDQEFSYQRESMVVEVNFVGAEIKSWNLLPITINYFTLQPHWAEEAEAEDIVAKMSAPK